MAKVDYTKIFSEPRNNILNLIKDTSNVSDPLSTSSQYRKWIYSRMPDVKANSFAGYPFIVLRSADLSSAVPETSGDGKHKFVDFDIEIEIFTSDRGHGTSSGNGLAHMESISDDIFQTLMDATNRKNLVNFGMQNQSIEPTAIAEITERNELVYRRIFPISFRSRMQVSA
jgi:hypothetical protein